MVPPDQHPHDPQRVLIAGGGVAAFVAPPSMPWPLPIYELALMTSRRAYDTQTEVAITIATPEDAPLAIFGSTVSEAVSRILEAHRIETITSAHSEVPEPGLVTIQP